MLASKPEFQSRPKESERATRKPISFWDRIKFLLLLAALFGFFVAAELADNPLLPNSEALRITLEGKWWILVLAALEVLREIHYFISEHSAGYHRMWQRGIFGRWNRRVQRIDPWKRYKISRAVKGTILVAVALLILARIFDTSIFRAPYEFLNFMLDATPQIVQIVGFLVFWIGFQFGLMIWFATRGGVETYFPDDIETRFSDVWGQDQVMHKVRENLVFLENPEIIEEKGGYVPSGLLLWGPPGTGKTLMAEAMAGETGKPFVNVDASQLNTMGMGPLKVKFLFRKLRKYALRYGGVVAFFDEADTIGRRGLQTGQPGPAMPMTPSPFAQSRCCGGFQYLSDASRSSLLSSGGDDVDIEEGRRRNRFFMGMGGMGGGGGVLPVLLTELSGLKKPRGLLNRTGRRVLGMKPKPPPKYRILVMMATNMPEALDEALLRPGRIDRIYKVGYPSKAGRVRTYKGYLEKIHHNITDGDVDRMATVTPYATGATIKDLVNESLINAIQDGRDLVTWGDMVKAKQLKDLGPPEDVEYIERERHATALHEACHAVIAYRARRHLVIDIATIEKGGNYLGMVSSIPPEDLFTRWRSEYEADVMVSLASLAGEKMFFGGDSSSGVSGDLESATQLTIFMEGYWGMGSTIASHGVTHRVGVAGGGRPGKPGEKKEHDLLRGSLSNRIEQKLTEIFVRTERLLEENRQAVLAVTHALETHKTLTGEDVEAIIEGRRGPLIDGTVYAGPDFLAAAEEYHAQVVAAHEHHGDVHMQMPTAGYSPRQWAPANGNGGEPHPAAVGTRAAPNGAPSFVPPAPAPAPARAPEPPASLPVAPVSNGGGNSGDRPYAMHVDPHGRPVGAPRYEPLGAGGFATQVASEPNGGAFAAEPSPVRWAPAPPTAGVPVDTAVAPLLGSSRGAANGNGSAKKGNGKGGKSGKKSGKGKKGKR